MNERKSCRQRQRLLFLLIRTLFLFLAHTYIHTESKRQCVWGCTMKQTTRQRKKTAKKGKKKKRRRESSPQSLKLINHSSVSRSTARQLIRCRLLTFKSFSDRLNENEWRRRRRRKTMNLYQRIKWTPTKENWRRKTWICKIACRHAHLTDLLRRVFNFYSLNSTHNSSMNSKQCTTHTHICTYSSTAMNISATRESTLSFYCVYVYVINQKL